MLNGKKKYLETIRTKAEQSLSKNKWKDFKGHLKITHRNHQDQYLMAESESSGKRKYTYIPKKNMAVVRALAQRDYDTEVILCIDKWMEWFGKSIEKIPLKTIDDIYKSSERRKLIKPYILSDEEFIDVWKKKPYKGKPFHDDTPEILAEQGHRVRSKSEKIIADKLFMKGIPYRYESPLKLNNGMIIYPDFTILNVRERKEYLLEHFGMMDNEEYLQHTVIKLNSYAKNGIFPGDKLLMTCETSETPLDVKALDALLKKYFG